MRETMLSMDPPKLPNDGRYSEEMTDFIDKCLQIDPKNRSNTNELLEHPWIQKYAEIDSELIQWVKEVNELKSQVNNDKRVSKEDVEMLGLEDYIGLK